MAPPESREALSRTILLCRQQLLGKNRLSDDVIADALLSTRVAIVCDAANLASPACQASISVLVRLITGYGASVTLIMPESRPVTPEPRFSDETEFVERLQRVAADGLPGPHVRRAERVGGEPVVFLMGDTTWSGDAQHVWRLTGSDWTGVALDTDVGAKPWRESWPLGGIAAAVAASAEPFKHAMRTLAPTLSEPVPLPELLHPLARVTVTLASGPTPPGFALGPVDAISGGAIIQAAVDTVLRVGGVRGELRVFEPEAVELSNLNRYQISRRRDLEPTRLKVESLKDAATQAFAIYGVADRFDPEHSRSALPLRHRVLVGADNLQARWAAQAQWPAWLGVGATADFMAMVSDHAPGSTCARCVHPFDDGVRDVIPTISFVSYWAGLLLATRLIASADAQIELRRGSVLEVNALRLDGPTGFRSYMPTRNPECPLRCRER